MKSDFETLTKLTPYLKARRDAEQKFEQEYAKDIELLSVHREKLVKWSKARSKSGTFYTSSDSPNKSPLGRLSNLYNNLNFTNFEDFIVKSITQYSIYVKCMLPQIDPTEIAKYRYPSLSATLNPPTITQPTPEPIFFLPPTAVTQPTPQQLEPKRQSPSRKNNVPKKLKKN